jgi:hypothetical protein
LDLQNEFVQLKTRGGQGDGPLDPYNTSSVTSQQGFEARDGASGDGPWVEANDSEGRGLWLSKNFHVGVWRAKSQQQQFMWMDDESNVTVIYNTEGKITIFSASSVEIISGGNIDLQAQENIRLKAGGEVQIDASNTQLLTVGSGTVRTNVPVQAPLMQAHFAEVLAGPGAGSPKPGGTRVAFVEVPTPPEKVEPGDRGATYNAPISCPVEEIEHKF